MFYESSQSGMPVARSLAIDYTYDPMVYDRRYQNQYLFGDAFMVAPVTSENQFLKVYLPVGEWYRYSTDELYSGNNEMIVEAPLNDLPVFVKAGSIIPEQSVIQFSGQEPEPILEVHVYRGDHFSAFTWYEDDGNTDNYLNGQFFKRLIIFDPQNRKVIFTGVEGTFPSTFTSYKLIFHGFNPGIGEKIVFNTKTNFEVAF